VARQVFRAGPGGLIRQMVTAESRTSATRSSAPTRAMTPAVRACRTLISPPPRTSFSTTEDSGRRRRSPSHHGGQDAIRRWRSVDRVTYEVSQLLRAGAVEVEEVGDVPLRMTGEVTLHVEKLEVGPPHRRPAQRFVDAFGIRVALDRRVLDRQPDHA